MPTPLPRRTPASALVALFPASRRPSPISRRVGFRVIRFEACSAFTRVPACMVAEPPEAALLPECFSPCRHLHEPPWPLPAGATVAGWDSHPPGKHAFPRRTGNKPDETIGQFVGRRIDHLLRDLHDRGFSEDSLACVPAPGGDGPPRTDHRRSDPVNLPRADPHRLEWDGASAAAMAIATFFFPPFHRRTRPPPRTPTTPTSHRTITSRSATTSTRTSTTARRPWNTSWRANSASLEPRLCKTPTLSLGRRG